MSTVLDIDRGWRAAMAALRGLNGRTVEVGIADPAVMQYAPIHEAKHGFIRDTLDAAKRQIGDELEDAARVASLGAPAASALRRVGENIAARIKAKIVELGLVDTGAMRDAVTSRDEDGTRR